MLKYAVSTVACLLVSATAFAGTPGHVFEAMHPAHKTAYLQGMIDSTSNMPAFANCTILSSPDRLLTAMKQQTSKSQHGADDSGTIFTETLRANCLNSDHGMM